MNIQDFDKLDTGTQFRNGTGQLARVLDVSKAGNGQVLTARYVWEHASTMPFTLQRQSTLWYGFELVNAEPAEEVKQDAAL